MTSSYNQTDDIDNVHSEARPSTQHCPISTSCSGPIVAARGCLQTDRNAVCFPYAIYIAASEIVRPRRPGLFVANGILGMVSIGGSKLQSQLHEFRCQRNLGLGINGEFRSQRKYCLQGSEARMLKDLQAVTAAVDHAWQIWRSDPSSENEAAYDQAYTEWRTFRGERRTGRPASGDAALTSTMRSHATRAHQQDAATRWGRVVLNIQRLRRA